MTPRLIRASYFIWLIIPLTGYVLFQVYGLPHVIWSYDWRNDGQGYDPFAKRHYTRCTYIGAFGTFTDNAPSQGRCDWFQFYKNDGGQ